MYYSGTIPNTSGIYLITCVPTQKIYVGSAVNLRHRRKCHFGDLQRNEHRNPKLQRAWNKYGPDAFTFEVLELVLIPEMLTAREQFWFYKLRPFGNGGFNIARVAGSWLGNRHSPEARAKMSIAQIGNTKNRGKKQSPEAREKLRQARIGNPLSEETKSRISIAGKGTKQSAEHVAKRIDPLRGRPLSEQTRAKLSASKKGQAPPPECYAHLRKTLIVTAPDGSEQSVTGIRTFCKANDLDISALMRVAQGKQKLHKGWKARFPDAG